MSNETDNGPATGQAEPGLESLGSADNQPAVDEDTELWTQEQIAEWRQQAAKAQEHWDRLVRVSADFDNFKKRAAREKQEAIRFANEGLITKLIPILDNFEMALDAANTTQGGSSEALATGVNMILSQLRSTLAEAGLEEINAAGQPFDPNWHEAVAQQPSAEIPEGNVLQQIRKGYKLKERLLRPASVIVAKQPAA
jgi:molecular chaperone GrpE